MRIIMYAVLVVSCLIWHPANLCTQTAVPTIQFTLSSATGGASFYSLKNLVLEERARTYISGNSTLQRGTVTISRSSPTATNPVNIRYSCEYFTVENLDFVTLALSGLKSLPNIGTDVRMLPEPIVSDASGCPQVRTTPAFPTPISVAINSFQGDLNPTIAVGAKQAVTFNAASVNNPGTVALGAGETSATLSFSARFSDQIFQPSKRTPGKQGVRAAIIRLLPSMETPPAYQIEPDNDSIRVILLDPPAVPPVISNGILNQIVEAPQGNTPRTGAISLETSSCDWRADNVPSAVFYDDNYELLNYTVTSERPDWVRVSIVQFDPAIPASSMLVYQVLPGAQAGTQVRITLIGKDGTVQRDGLVRLATAEFYINIVRSLTTSVAQTQEPSRISVSPNPTGDMLTVSGVAEFSGQMFIRIMDSAGRIMLTKSSLATAGASYKETVDVRNVASGMYLVEVENGGIKQVQKVIKQ